MFSYDLSHYLTLASVGGFILTIPSYAIIIDLDRSVYPQDVEVYHASFIRGGLHRIFHGRTEMISAVKYKTCYYNTMLRNMTSVTDVYVQEYRRGSEIYIETNRCIKGVQKQLHTTFCKIVAPHCVLLTRRDKMLLAASISIPINLNHLFLHPFLVRSREEEEDGTSISLDLVSKRAYNKKLNGCRILRFTNPNIFISPIYGLDSQTNASSYSNPMLISQSVKIYHVLGTMSITLWLKGLPSSESKFVEIPPISDGIFRPRNIVRFALKFNEYVDNSRPSTSNHLYIYVDSVEVSVPDIIILANLKRGDWLYTQYSILGSRYLEYPTIGVKSSQTGQMIYSAAFDEYVRYVEIFTHVFNQWKFVVVSITKFTKGVPHRLKKIYLRERRNRVDYYIELYDSCANSSLDMIYNIKIINPTTDANNATLESHNYLPPIEKCLASGIPAVTMHSMGTHIEGSVRTAATTHLVIPQTQCMSQYDSYETGIQRGDTSSTLSQVDTFYTSEYTNDNNIEIFRQGMTIGAPVPYTAYPTNYAQRNEEIEVPIEPRASTGFTKVDPLNLTETLADYNTVEFTDSMMPQEKTSVENSFNTPCPISQDNIEEVPIEQIDTSETQLSEPSVTQPIEPALPLIESDNIKHPSESEAIGMPEFTFETLLSEYEHSQNPFIIPLTNFRI
ncbi:putative integral membrane protein [Babesia bovis T2Bo]|uniref:Uncharacterized protein n=1 Tax=Babesia bovis TaxID=5865 RepID=A7AW92_BABBO|nr:putative integral membrane protein [Babesia bovis T2Bo]EDO05320.1 putative integral membrane protein [Babesia bovis T2Bo]|eukprot:XP_001608888.1 hypothetical protein [Babesia bovis T2Bo]